MATSFLSEHTIEYCLVPKLNTELEKYWKVTPIYFWSTREGSNLSQKCDHGEQINILAMYARRPKLSRIGDKKIQVKLNASIQERAFSLKKIGIPTICGIPLVSSIFEFKLSCSCIWLSIAPEGCVKYKDIIIEYINDTCITTNVYNNESLYEITTADIIKIIMRSASMTLCEAISEIKGIRRTYNSISFSRNPWFQTNYKPVYFLLRRKAANK